MRFINPLPFVADLDRARRFYRDVMGLRILEDEGGFIRFEGGFALHDGAGLHQMIFGQAPEPAPFGRANLVLYFEDPDLDAAFARIAPQVDLVHPSCASIGASGSSASTTPTAISSKSESRSSRGSPVIAYCSLDQVWFLQISPPATQPASCMVLPLMLALPL